MSGAVLQPRPFGGGGSAAILRLDDDHRTAVRRPEHVLAAARRPREAAGPGLRCRLRRPGPRVPAPGRPRPRAARARRVRRGPRLARPARPRARDRTRDPGPRLHLRPAAGHGPRRDPAPAGQAEPGARAGRHRGLDDRGRHPDARTDRGARHDRGRRHVLAPARPVLHRPDAADERGRARPAGRRSSAATCASSTSRTGAARPSSSTSCRSSRRSPTTWRSSTCRSCRSGCGSCSATSGIRLVEVPDEEFPTLGCNVLAVRPGRRDRGRGQSRERPPPWPPPAARSTPIRRPRSAQRLGRADLHDPADPAWLTRHGARPRSIATGSSRTCRRWSGSRASPGPRRPSRTGPPTPSASSGSPPRSTRPEPAAIRADPDWPGEEMPRTSLPVVIGRAGRPAGGG